MNYLNEAIKEAKNGINQNEGGPFGAVIVNQNGEIVGRGNNKVLSLNDPTAHAEIIAIRDACQKMNTYDLTGYKIYTTSEPCPMCLSAIIWSNIIEIYYATDKKQVSTIGFRDDLIYHYFQNKTNNLIKTTQIKNDDCLKLLKDYHHKIY